VKLRELLPGARRKPKKTRPDAPRTIVPVPEEADRFDAAKARLREQIPPPTDED
jgi:hypothetical protein